MATAGAILLAALVVVYVAAWWWFRRRTMRVVTLVLLGLAVFSGAVASFFDVGMRMRRYFDDYWWPGGAVILLVLAGFYVVLEGVAARRESPRVDVVDPDDDRDDTSALVAALRARLSAIEVSKPSPVPGGQVGESVAAVVESTGVQGSNLASAFVELGYRILPTPRAYSVRVRIEDDPESTDPLQQVTVELHDRTTGRSTDVITLPPLPRTCVSEHAAAFVACRVFARDPATPEWVKGKFDGEDLAAYLLSKQPRCGEKTFDSLRADRLRCLHVLERAVSDGPAAGVARDELASLYELEGRYGDALRMHALNRLHFGRDFHRGRYRLAMVLSMLASDRFGEAWPSTPLRVRQDVVRYLERAGAYKPKQAEVTPHRFVVPRQRDFVAVRRVMLDIARDELVEIRNSLSWWRQLAACVVHRSWRSSLQPATVLTPRGFVERARHRRKLSSAVRIVDERAARLRGKSLPPASEPKGWERRVSPPWAELYNEACLLAIRTVEGKPAGPLRRQATAEVVRALRRAVDDPGCELYRPSTLISVNRDLQCLRGDRRFKRFVEDQLRRDFAMTAPPAKPREGGLPDAWMAARLTNAFRLVERESGERRVTRRPSLARAYRAERRHPPTPPPVRRRPSGSGDGQRTDGSLGSHYLG